MTIGIAARGKDAGRAVLAALGAVEAVGSGAIGGFVSAVALHRQTSIRATVQRGGARALRIAGDRTAFERAPLAALISSGPDRPEPLAAFVAAEPGVGLVTGHRLPNAPGRDGVALNEAVLALLRAGRPPRAAIELVLAANPSADAGLIALDTAGNAFAANTSSVAARPDAGRAYLVRGEAGALVLHNAISPSGALAALAAEIALDVLAPTVRHHGSLTLRRGCPVRAGARAQVVAGEDGRIEEIVVPSPPFGESRVVGLGYRPSVVVGDELRGVLLYEPFVLAVDGRVVSADGRARLELPFGTPA